MLKHRDIWLDKFAAICCFVGGAASVAGTVLLFLFVISFPAADDYPPPIALALVVVHFILLLPVAFALFRRFRETNSRINRPAFVVGVISMLVLAGLYGLAIAIEPEKSDATKVFAVPFAGLVFWILTAGALGRRMGLFATSWWLDLQAAAYLAYPIWAYKVGRSLWVDFNRVNGPAGETGPAAVEYPAEPG